MKKREPLKPSNEWLDSLNRKLSDEGIPPERRPFIALQRFEQDFGVAVQIPSPVSNRIFEWFGALYPSQIGARPFFRGAFFFDATFWPVFIPLVYGTANMRPLDSLPTMTGPIRSMLVDSEEAWPGFTRTWEDCYAYAYGLEGVIGHARRPPSVSPFAVELMRSADNELRAAISLLLELPPNPDAIFRARSALEKAIKGLLVERDGLTEKEAGKVRHDIEDLVVRGGFSIPAAYLQVYPPHASSYKGHVDRPAQDLWIGYMVAQRISRKVVDHLSVDV